MRFGAGWELAKKSLVVVREDGSLVALTILGAISAGAIGLALFVPAAILSHRGSDAAAVLLAALGAYFATATGVFFAVALAACAAEVLDGLDATVGGGIRIAFSRLHVILGWALALTTVNLAIRLLSRQGLIGEILSGVADIAWSVATFLVIPILALEGLGPIEAIKRSSALFRQRWGEQLAGRVWIGGIFFLLGLLPAVGLVVLGAATGSTTFGVVLVVLGVLSAWPRSWSGRPPRPSSPWCSTATQRTRRRSARSAPMSSRPQSEAGKAVLERAQARADSPSGG